MTKQFVTALLVKPGETPRTRKVSPDFNSMRRIIGANAEELCPFADAVAVVYDPDGLVRGDGNHVDGQHHGTVQRSEFRNHAILNLNPLNSHLRCRYNRHLNKPSCSGLLT